MMNSYRILGVSENASEEEIQIAYEDLKRMYDPVVNTSSSAYSKYREIIKAYNSIKDEQDRKLYNLEQKVKSTIEINKKTIVSDDYSLFDFDTFKNSSDLTATYDHLEIEQISKYSLSEINETVNSEVEARFLKDRANLIYKQVDYLDFLLGTSKKVELNILEKCDECVLNYITCHTCNGIGKTSYAQEVVNCPTCFAKGEIKVSNCNACNNKGHTLVKKTVTLNLAKSDSVTQEFTLGEYNNLKVILKAKDSDNYKIENNNILINYHLTKDELKYGVNKDYVTPNGTLNINTPPYTKNLTKTSYEFEGYKLVFTFISNPYNGENINRFIFIKESDLYKTHYLNPLTLNFQQRKDTEHYFEFRINTKLEPLIVSGKGDKGLNGGKNGDLVLTPLLTYKRINSSKYINFEERLVDTSLMFNLFGGKNKDLFNIGLKLKNAVVVDKKNSILYILSGNKKEKRTLSSYFLINLIIILIWILIPALLLVIPFNKQNLIIVTGLLLVYAIISNIAINWKV